MDFLGEISEPGSGDPLSGAPIDVVGDAGGASDGDHPLLTYAFGTGDGSLREWSSAADRDLDADGTLDSVAVDFDGDGATDDAMWDSDGDGRADLAALDIGTNDGDRPDTFYSDTGRGLWDHRVHDVAVARADTEGPSAPQARAEAAVPDPPPAAARADTPTGSDAAPTDPATDRHDLDGDGRMDDRVVDPDSSGRATVGLVFAGSDDPAPVRVLIDLDSDGQFDGVVIDDDADGVADAWALRGEPGFDPGSGSADAQKAR